MSIGAQFMCQDFEECMTSVKKAEEAGYEYAWFIDSQILWQDVYVYMTSGLDRTEKIVFGTAVTNPWTRHVTVTASAYATLAQLHPGRLVLGIGRGDSAVRTMGLNPVPTKMLRESIPVLRELMAGRTVRLNDADVHFRWVTEDVAVPICMSATGPKNLRAAGALADRVMLYVGVNPVSIRGRWSTCAPGPRRRDATRIRSRSRFSPRCGSRTIRRRRGRSAAGPPPPARTTSRTR